jgi:hypothetical protein
MDNAGSRMRANAQRREAEDSHDKLPAALDGKPVATVTTAFAAVVLRMAAGTARDRMRGWGATGWPGRLMTVCRPTAGPSPPRPEVAYDNACSRIIPGQIVEADRKRLDS